MKRVIVLLLSIILLIINLYVYKEKVSLYTIAFGLNDPWASLADATWPSTKRAVPRSA